MLVYWEIDIIKVSKIIGTADAVCKNIKDNPRMVMDVDAARVINVITGMDIEISDDREKIDMCEAIEGMMADSKQIGRNEILTKIAERLQNKGISKEDMTELLGITEEELENILHLN